ncbi:MAG: hypothetical protein COT89_02300 [Candidatus Colwellbacteria bacterium CG10_big_fil_rev_8_21_14_0_10_42_22]|uniref:Glycerate kinase n=1 Tax=Candidatus Colwellbacteria bacterium CG10_big_fil_rev_8_21_14_0_10_42_22 TaxID=1974540 RepID=A0A2H0VHU5_9BACT|nr:MAG: hypothetical protein COT89_02300 [Candidatus Colwellbacteria bacterium CG10_big_fil_rev_8_21_14_0_10_42_22]
MKGKIKNFKELANTDLRRTLLEVVEVGLEAIDTSDVIREDIVLEGDMFTIGDNKYSLKDIENLYVIGAGKCVLEATEVLEEVLGDRLMGGFVVDVSVPRKHKLKKIKCSEGTHPLPSSANVRASGYIQKLLKDTTEKDMVIFVISGGGSTLLCLPEKGGDCKTEAKILKTLSSKGASIEEINTLRKHMSLVRGGFLAKHAYPAKVVSIILSDVPGNDLEFIASGPTVKDRTTVQDAEEIIKKYDLLKDVKPHTLKLIETPKEDKYFKNVDNIMFVSNQRALNAMAQKAKDLGYRSEIITTAMTGEARDVAQDIVKELHKKESGTVLLYGGETTVTIKVKGKGGRNRELVLSALLTIGEGEVLASVASDGRDNSEYAGAIADVETLTHAKAKELNVLWYLDNNQSDKFFKETKDYIMTGDTGSNVSDLVIAIKK